MPGRPGPCGRPDFAVGHRGVNFARGELAGEFPFAGVREDFAVTALRLRFTVRRETGISIS